ncbi:Pam16-domain-containing protein [Lophiotrema nucula]|uniref:Mitochondrial import inner membrane translocase subunit TIM16 n=1 Tax=Lophiotrema nucula TaxID=690887 RepID=A0A6A5ZA09_9PLEO|nr:Pam16-domain-containing protein [Lophiotrema nucula]
MNLQQPQASRSPNLRGQFLDSISPVQRSIQHPASLSHSAGTDLFHSVNAQLDSRFGHNPMAHRIITQVVFSGARIIGRAVAESYRQAAASQKYAAATQKTGGGAFASSNITMEEACKILNVGPSRMGQIDMEHVTERFKRMFDLNEPSKGGSFYLQSKILRARERIEREVRGFQQMAEREAELKEGFKPKFTKE